MESRLDSLYQYQSLLFSKHLVFYCEFGELEFERFCRFLFDSKREFNTVDRDLNFQLVAFVSLFSIPLILSLYSETSHYHSVLAPVISSNTSIENTYCFLPSPSSFFFYTISICSFRISKWTNDCLAIIAT